MSGGISSVATMGRATTSIKVDGTVQAKATLVKATISNWAKLPHSRRNELEERVELKNRWARAIQQALNAINDSMRNETIVVEVE